MHTLVRRYLPRWGIGAGGIDLFRPQTVRRRAIPLPGHQSIRTTDKPNSD